MAANRIGKTVSTCFETACHLTGLYPDWWQGHRFTSPITCMVAGEGWSQVALVLQNELLGTQDVKITEKGRVFTRNVAMAFDLRMMRKMPETRLFSMTV